MPHRVKRASSTSKHAAPWVSAGTRADGDGDGDTSPHVRVVVVEGRRRACCNSPKQCGSSWQPSLDGHTVFLDSWRQRARRLRGPACQGSSAEAFHPISSQATKALSSGFWGQRHAHGYAHGVALRGGAPCPNARAGDHVPAPIQLVGASPSKQKPLVCHALCNVGLLPMPPERSHGPSPIHPRQTQNIRHALLQPWSSQSILHPSQATSWERASTRRRSQQLLRAIGPIADCGLLAPIKSR
ncbi:hypothetical protein COCMIDRAFT_26753 [Bipolaris oryzae ATCC 44560]|uniref:Uncharacterized protein n=1 Tax=Bipolaris oryzae ATCC 44560 TaxID=930090 RepID=W6Z032_COCMI|nr:uncharacterized protein COCMIDRAFT_26753 [Bipolaris oryzae ATCC 44560]EUC44987.1 hypothetical protein COCMIDRAFT_26753 [Bipolaris oryzae ATCC 44560]